MHSRKRGNSGSTRPARLEKPTWVEPSPEEVESEVVKLARRGQSKSMIGTIMRDSRGVPLVKLVTGKKVTQILLYHGQFSKEEIDTIFQSSAKETTVYSIEFLKHHPEIAKAEALKSKEFPDEAEEEEGERIKEIKYIFPHYS